MKLKKRILLPIVFAGGGVLGLAHIGMLMALEEMGIYPSHLAGTSAGAIFSALLSVGCTSEEILSLFLEKDLTEFLDPVSRIPLIRFFSWHSQSGIYQGEVFRLWLNEILIDKLGKSTTFADIKTPLLITATDIIKQELVIFSQKTSPKMLVADAVRASISIPGLFKPFEVGNSKFVDGGILNNVPADIMSKTTKTPMVVVGFERSTELIQLEKGFLRLFIQVLATMLHAPSKARENDALNSLLIQLKTLGVGVTEFKISKSKKLELILEAKNTTLTAFQSEKGQDFLNKLQGI